MEQMSDIRNVLTPLSLGTNGSSHPARALWKQGSTTKVRFTSTSTPAKPPTVDSLLLRPSFPLDASYLDESALAESPILPAPTRVNLIFGRKQSLESDRRSISTSILQTLGKMELCNNNNDSAQENLQKKNMDKMRKKCEGENSSSIDAKEKFKKQLNRNKKNKAITPKKKSPKVYKIGLKKIVPEVQTKKSAGSSKAVSSSVMPKKKSPKNKSPKTYKICPTKKVVGSSIAAKKTKDPSKAEPDAGNSENYSHATKHSELKMSKCAKSPKLRTAERALTKQHREEMRKEKEKMLEMYKQKELEEQKRREEEELMKIRQQTLFKAHPIRKYAPLPNVKKRPLTDPISPNISKKRRIESSSQTSSHTGHSKTMEEKCETADYFI